MLHGLTVAYGDSIVVDGVSLTVSRGEVLGLVGESGSGKSQTAFSILGLLPPDAEVSADTLEFGGQELQDLNRAAMNKLRGRHIAYIPQEPMSNLDPSFRIGDAAHRADAPAPRAVQGRGQGEGDRAARARRDPGAGARLPRLPARDLRRHGAARADRRRRVLRPGAADRRRADHGAGRDRPGRGARPDALAPAGAQHGPDPGHPRLRRGGRHLRPRRGHAVRPDRGERPRGARCSRTRSTRTRGCCSIRPSRTPSRVRRSCPPRTKEPGHERAAAGGPGRRGRVSRPRLPQAALQGAARRLPGDRRRRDARPGRRVRLGQDDDRPGDPRARARDGRRDPLRRPRHLEHRQGRAPRSSATTSRSSSRTRTRR